MKSLITGIFCLLATLIPSLEASTSHQLTIQGSDIAINVIDPEGFSEAEIANLDLVYQDPNDKGRNLAFHYFLDPNFKLGSFNEVFEYTDWLTEPLFGNAAKTQSSFSSSKDYARRSFKTTDMSGTPIYCYIYVGKIADELVFASLSTSYTSLDKAVEDAQFFLKNVFWEKK